MNPAATVYVVDDDEAVRGIVQALVESVGGKAETYGSADEFLEHWDAARPSCLVLDIEMPGASGLQLMRTLAERGIETPVVFITRRGDVSMCAQAMKAGALDFFEKPVDEQQLLDAIQRGLARDAERQRERALREEVRRRAAMLTRREREVMRRVVSGRTSREIAAELGTAEKTIKAHRAQVMRKMRARSIVELVQLAQVIGVCRPLIHLERVPDPGPPEGRREPLGIRSHPDTA